MNFTNAFGVRAWLRSLWQWIFEITAPGLPAWLGGVLNLVIMPSPLWVPVLFGILMKRRHGRMPPSKALLLRFNTLILLLFAFLWFSFQFGDGGPEALGGCFVHWLTFVAMFPLMLLWTGSTKGLLLANISILVLLGGRFFAAIPSFPLTLLGVVWLGSVALLLYRQTRRRVSSQEEADLGSPMKNDVKGNPT